MTRSCIHLGGMALAAAVLAMSAGSAMAAKKAPEPMLEVSYPGDGAMTCEQLAVEASRMNQIMGISDAQAASAEAGAQAANLGASVAVHAALYSGALGRVPGLGLFANGASSMARMNAEAKAKRAAQDIQTAQQRRAMIMGIYQGRGCGAPAPAPVAQVAPAPAAAPAPAPVPATSQ
ncbi:MAG: hypothetical protein ACXW3D_06525 [Caulobacteraceae bacterium]